MLTLWKSLILSGHMITAVSCGILNTQGKSNPQNWQKTYTTSSRKSVVYPYLSYWDQLSKLNIYSLERRQECYITIYTWKILEGSVPNAGSENNAITATWHARRGRECNIPNIATTAPTKIQNIHRASLTVNGPRIFNSLSQYISDTTECDKNVFKAHLDHYLQQVPAQSLIPGYTLVA